MALKMLNTKIYINKNLNRGSNTEKTSGDHIHVHVSILSHKMKKDKLSINIFKKWHIQMHVQMITWTKKVEKCLKKFNKSSLANFGREDV